MLMELLTDGSKDQWAETYGLEFPVLEDDDQDIVRGFVSGSFGIPMYVVLDRNLEMVAENVGHGQAFQLADELLDSEIPDHSDEWPMPGELDLTGIEADIEAGEAAPSGNSFDAEATSAFGGASCSAAAGGAGGGSVLFALLGALGIRRRR